MMNSCWLKVICLALCCLYMWTCRTLPHSQVLGYPGMVYKVLTWLWLSNYIVWKFPFGKVKNKQIISIAILFTAYCEDNWPLANTLAHGNYFKRCSKYVFKMHSLVCDISHIVTISIWMKYNLCKIINLCYFI